MGLANKLAKKYANKICTNFKITADKNGNKCIHTGMPLKNCFLSKEDAKLSKKEYKERYIIRFNDRIIPLKTTEIAYIYSEEKNNYLVTVDGHKYIIDSSLDVMSEELDPEHFFRISRSCILAMKSIRSILKQAGGRLRITADPASSFEMTVSRSRVDDFLAWLEK